LIATMLFRPRALAGIRTNADHLGAPPENWGLLKGFPAKSADTEHPQDPIRGERPGVAEFLDPPVRSQAGIGQRSEFLELETTVDLECVALGDGDELGKSPVRTESGPAYVWANLCVSDLAMTAGLLAPPLADH